jgi:LysR family transcriptional regulator, hydrogen peroxide-inducible genes activator
MLTITQIEYLVAVDRFRHFGKAAKACHISQPTLSMQIHKAEELLGFLVFDRLKKPLLPTEKGHMILEQAKVVLREHRRLIQVGKDTEREISGEFRLGIIPTLAPYVIPLFLEKFSTDFPQVKLHVDELKTADIVSQLKNDTLDGGVLATPLHEPGLNEKHLFYESFFLYLHEKHPLQKRPYIRESDLNEHDFWLLKDGHCFREQVLSFCGLSGEGSGLLANVRFEGSNFETLLNLVRSVGGYTLIPHLAILRLPSEERKRLVRPFATPVPTREVGLVFRRYQWKSLILNAIEESIRSSIPDEVRKARASKREILDPVPK